MRFACSFLRLCLRRRCKKTRWIASFCCDLTSKYIFQNRPRLHNTPELRNGSRKPQSAEEHADTEAKIETRYACWASSFSEKPAQVSWVYFQLRPVWRLKKKKPLRKVSVQSPRKGKDSFHLSSSMWIEQQLPPPYERFLTLMPGSWSSTSHTWSTTPPSPWSQRSALVLAGGRLHTPPKHKTKWVTLTPFCKFHNKKKNLFIIITILNIFPANYFRFNNCLCVAVPIHPPPHGALHTHQSNITVARLYSNWPWSKQTDWDVGARQNWSSNGHNTEVIAHLDLFRSPRHPWIQTMSAMSCKAKLFYLYLAAEGNQNPHSWLIGCIEKKQIRVPTGFLGFFITSAVETGQAEFIKSITREQLGCEHRTTHSMCARVYVC